MNWQFKEKTSRSFLNKFPEFSPLTGQMLYHRGIKTQQQIDEFFNPDFSSDLHNPFLLKDMDKAVTRIKKALQKKEKILIYGDFDADGVCSSAILYHTLKALGCFNLETYIPDREKENHGLNKKSIQLAKKKKIDLIITVDCGSSDFQEAVLAKKLGIDLVITDHHEMLEKKPIVQALINPYQKKEKYPFKQLAGAGVAYKLACALFEEMGDPDNFKKWLLDLTALATVADVMPLLGENRTIVKYGLGVLAQTRWLGLQKLMEITKITPEILEPSLDGKAPTSNLDTFTLGFMLAPRLNAPGRLEHASLAFNLLISQNSEAAWEMAVSINQQNIERQRLADDLASQLDLYLSDLPNKPKIIFQGEKDWPIGLLGLVAGKIKEKYQRPTVLYCQNQNQFCASIRGIPQFDLINLLSQCQEYFNDYGGHRLAGGFRMKKNEAKLAEVKKKFEQFAEKELKGIDLNPVLEIESEIKLADFNLENYQKIQEFAPFGKSNPEPIFYSQGLEVVEARLVGNGQKHLKLDLLMFDQGNSARKIKAIGFGLSEYFQKLKPGKLIDAAFKLILNQWNGFKDLEMKIVDLKINS